MVWCQGTPWLLSGADQTDKPRENPQARETHFSSEYIILDLDLYLWLLPLYPPHHQGRKSSKRAGASHWACPQGAESKGSEWNQKAREVAQQQAHMVRSTAFHWAREGQRVERGRGRSVAWAFTKFEDVEVSAISTSGLRTSYLGQRSQVQESGLYNCKTDHHVFAFYPELRQ